MAVVRTGGDCCLVLAALLVACGSSQPPVPSGPSRTAGPVTEISLERNCFGCPDRHRVTLRRDGSASRTELGSAREGTPDRESMGSVDVKEFLRLETLILSRGFFGLDDEYRDPQLRDGSWLITAATRDEVVKRVLDHNQAGPAALRSVEDAIAAVAAGLTWRPASPRPEPD